MTTTKPVFMLKGDALANFVNEKEELINRGEMTYDEMMRDAGYVNDTGSIAVRAFCTELLNAKRIAPVTDTVKEFFTDSEWDLIYSLVEGNRQFCQVDEFDPEFDPVSDYDSILSKMQTLFN